MTGVNEVEQEAIMIGLCLAISTEHWRVTDGQTDGYLAIGLA